CCAAGSRQGCGKAPLLLLAPEPRRQRQCCKSRGAGTGLLPGKRRQPNVLLFQRYQEQQEGYDLLQGQRRQAMRSKGWEAVLRRESGEILLRQRCYCRQLQCGKGLLRRKTASLLQAGSRLGTWHKSEKWVATHCLRPIFSSMPPARLYRQA